jgi:hypothetical protein
MSYCQIIEFRDGKPGQAYEFRNAWGGAARIWNALYDRYLKDPKKEYDTWAFGGDHKKFWQLAERKDLPVFERAVHASTFDRAMIRREHFAAFAEHLREFVKAYPVGGDTYDHLPKWADIIEASDAEAIGFHGTSVSDNLWMEYDEQTDESTPYDLNSEDRHFEVHDYILTDAAAP